MKDVVKSHIMRTVVFAAVFGLLVPLATDYSIAGAQEAAPSASVVEDASADPGEVTPAPHGEEVSSDVSTPTPTPTPTQTPSSDPRAITTPAVTPTPVPTESAQGDGTPDQGDGSEAAGTEQRSSSLAAADAVPVPPTGRITASTDAHLASVSATKVLFPGGADTVVLVNGAYPIFASAAAPLVAQRGAAVLYVQSTVIPSAVMAELRRLAPTSIVIVGGPVYVSEAVVGAARTVASDVTRVGGANLYETSRLVFAQQTGQTDTVYLAGAATNHDPALASVIARAKGKKVLVVNGHSAPLDQATIDLLRGAGTRSIVIVRSAAAAMAPAYEPALRSAGFEVTRLAHIDARTLSMLVAGQAGTPAVSMLVNPDRPAHVGIAAAAAAAIGQPLYFPRRECVPDAMAAQISATGKPLLLLGDTAALQPSVASNTNCTTEKTKRQAALYSKIRATMSGYAGTYSVTVRELGGLNEVTNVGGGVRREPASMIKVFAAWAAYKRIQQGLATTSTRLSSGIPLGTCIHLMIHVSDNYCHSDIVHWIGISQLNAMIRGAGFTNTYYGSVPRGTSVLYAGNRTTSNDLALLMNKLSSGTILSTSYVNALFKIMGSQIGRSRIPSGIPPGVKQVSKPGALWIASGLMQGDTAIVYGGRVYALSIIGDDNPPKAAFRAISRTVYEHFNGTFGAAASYPREQMTTRWSVGLRSSPGGGVVVTVPGGTNVEQLDSIRDWYIVQYGTRKLWVHFSALRNR